MRNYRITDTDSGVIVKSFYANTEKEAIEKCEQFVRASMNSDMYRYYGSFALTDVSSDPEKIVFKTFFRV